MATVAHGTGGALARRWASRRSVRIRPRPGALVRAAALLAPFAVFAGHAALFGDWLIDDAGISFAYARNLALGHGLVAQPGAAPVEGFSNPLWTLLLAAAFWSGLFSVAWTPKLLAAACVVIAYWLIWRNADHERLPLWARPLGLVLLALSTSSVLWTTSGLENALFAALLAASCTITRRALVGNGSPRLDVAAGVVAALVALTRPDGILMAAAFPLSLVAAGLVLGTDRRALGLRLLRFAAGLAPLLDAYLAFRRYYYGDWLPNTYYAKERPSLLALGDLPKAVDLLASVFGAAAPLVVVLLALETFRFCRRALAPRRAALLAHLGLATAAYLMLPLDWMGEYRFATGAILFLHWWLAEVLAEGWRRARRIGLPADVLAAAVVACLVADSAVRHARRSRDFADAPVTPFARIAEVAGHGYNALADALDLEDASLLAPDMGGALYYSRLRVVDLVGLCDRTVARTLTRDTRAFHAYVFGDVRPTFIHVHGPWAGWAALHKSGEFRRDYVPIHESWLADDAGWSDEPGQGDYVRRDALAGDPAALARLRGEFLSRRMGLRRF